MFLMVVGRAFESLLKHTRCLLRPLHWRHNERDGFSNHRRRDYLLNRLFRRRTKKIPKLRITGLCARNSPVPGEFPACYTKGQELGRYFHLMTSLCHVTSGDQQYAYSQIDICSVMPQSHYTPGPRTGCSRVVPGLFWTKIVRPLTGPVRRRTNFALPYGARRVLMHAL